MHVNGKELSDHENSFFSEPILVFVRVDFGKTTSANQMPVWMDARQGNEKEVIWIKLYPSPAYDEGKHDNAKNLKVAEQRCWKSFLTNVRNSENVSLWTRYDRQKANNFIRTA